MSMGCFFSSEWNPHSLQALEAGFRLNFPKEKMVIERSESESPLVVMEGREIELEDSFFINPYVSAEKSEIMSSSSTRSSSKSGATQERATSRSSIELTQDSELTRWDPPSGVIKHLNGCLNSDVSKRSHFKEHRVPRLVILPGDALSDWTKSVIKTGGKCDRVKRKQSPSRGF